jgi:large subunit ribosomal protein L15
VVSKTKKYRGGRTHGRGRKAGRGAGLRGGKGNAGLHKHKYMHMLKYLPDHFGRRGFKRPPGAKKEKTCINLMELEEALPGLLEDGIAIKGKDFIRVSLDKIGIDKLLSKGHITTKMKVEVREVSEKAKMKIESLGGQVIQIQSAQQEDGEIAETKDDNQSEGINGGGT